MRKRILIADDDPAVRGSVEKLLASAGYEVICAGDGQEAESKISPEIDLLILDLGLPNKDGWNVFGLATAFNPLLPVIILTGLRDQADSALIPGIAAFLEKPVDALVLLNIVARLLSEPPQERLRRLASGFQRGLQRSVQVFAFAVLLTFGLSSLASPQKENPYREIALRNVFGLRPATSSSKNVTAAPAPVPTIFLTGITTILGGKRAFLEVTPPAKPGQPAQKPQSCVLTVGESEAGVKVLEIDAKHGQVKVSTAGTTLELTFDKNGKKIQPPPPRPPRPPAFPQRRLPTIRTASLR